MNKDVSAEEMALCIEAISSYFQGEAESFIPPEEVYSHTFSDGRYIYINFIKPANVPIGSIYRTWIVRFNGDKPESVHYFRSRRGEAGDDTLPPEE